MDHHKPKTHHYLPNRQLAEVFNFSSEDLAANRLGFLTREQKWNIPLLMRPLTEPMFAFLPTHQREPVEHICGRIILEVSHISPRSISYVRWSHILSMGDGYLIKFGITDEQYAILSKYNNRPHHIYYMFRGERRSRIVAIELAEFGC